MSESWSPEPVHMYVIKIKDHEVLKDSLDDPGGSNLITFVLKGREQSC